MLTVKRQRFVIAVSLGKRPFTYIVINLTLVFKGEIIESPINGVIVRKLIHLPCECMFMELKTVFRHTHLLMEHEQNSIAWFLFVFLWRLKLSFGNCNPEQSSAKIKPSGELSADSVSDSSLRRGSGK